MLDPHTLEPLEAQMRDADAHDGEELSGPMARVAEPRVAAPAAAPIEHVIDVAVVRPAGSSNATTITDDGVTILVKKLSAYWSAQTGGQISFIRLNPTILRYSSEYSCSEPGYLMPDAARRFGVDDTVYNKRTGRHLLVIVPKSCGSTGQGSAGIGDLVVSPANGGVIWMQDLAWGLDIVAHEFGHNLGLRHANSHECPNAPDGKPVFEGTPDVSARSFSDGCATEEYGDRVDVMGNISVINGQVNTTPPVLSVSNALSLGVMAPEAVERISLVGPAQRADRQVTLASVSAPTGTRGVVVTDPISGAEYIFEYRDGSGPDAQTLFGRGKLTDYGVGFGIRMLTNRAGASSEVFTVADPSVYYERRQHFEEGETLTSRTGGVSVTILSIQSGVARLAIAVGAKPLVPTPVGASIPTIVGELTPGATLSVVPGIWSTAAFSSAWAADGVAIPGADRPTLVLDPAQNGHAITVTLTGTKADYLPVSRTSAPGLKVAGARPEIVGDVTIGSTLVAETPGWAAGTSFGYQWFANGVAISGATESTFVVTPLQVAQRMTVEVMGANEGYADATQLSEPRVVPIGSLHYAFLPSPGEKLSWPESTRFAGQKCCVFSYRWLVNGVVVAGASGPTYSVSAKLAAGSEVVLDVGVRSAGIPLATTLKSTISGSAMVGATLTAQGLGADADDLAIQWFANGGKIAGAINPTLLVSASFAGKAISVQHTWRYGALTSKSPSTLRVSRASVPQILGNVTTGAVLTAQPGAWTASMVKRYQWSADGVDIPGARSAKLTVGAVRLGQKIAVTVTGTRAGYTPVSETSAATAPVLLPLVTKPLRITGTAKNGRVLTAAVAAWGPAAVPLSYQWYDGPNPIANANGPTFVLTAAQIGRRISVAVTAVKEGYLTVTLVSAATAKVVR